MPSPMIGIPLPSVGFDWTVLGMRKKLAKHIIFSFVIIEILIDIVLGIKYSILPSKKFNYYGNISASIFVFAAYFERI